MSMTIVMLYNVSHMNGQGQGIEHSDDTSRVLLSEVEEVVGMSLWYVAGIALGWASSLIYISSRFPQLSLMMRSKDVSGINPAFFCLTFTGNLTQCLSMLINRQIYTDP